MSKISPEMQALFGGEPSGGFFDLPLTNPGESGGPTFRDDRETRG